FAKHRSRDQPLGGTRTGRHCGDRDGISAPRDSFSKEPQVCDWAHDNNTKALARATRSWRLASLTPGSPSPLFLGNPYPERFGGRCRQFAHSRKLTGDARAGPQLEGKRKLGCWVVCAGGNGKEEVVES